MQNKLVIYFFLLIFLSCSQQLKDSVGPNNQVNIFVSDEDKEIIELYLHPIFEKNIMTPTNENLYDVNIVNASEFIDKKYYKNIIIASVSEPIDSTGDLLHNKFKNIYNKNIFSVDNIYAKKQRIICFKADDFDDFVESINNFNSWILNSVNENIYINYNDDYSNLEKEENITNLIKNKFAIEINVDENYKIIKNTKNFLWIGRGHPYRWIIINEGTLDMQHSYKDYIINLFEEKLTNVNIVDKYVKYDDNKSIRGLYEQYDSDTGGPFFTYMFENDTHNKVIFVSGFVNNPGKKKADLLFQLETIIKNIKVL